MKVPLFQQQRGSCSQADWFITTVHVNDECRDPSERDRLSSVGYLTHFGFVISLSYSPKKCDLK